VCSLTVQLNSSVACFTPDTSSRQFDIDSGARNMGQRLTPLTHPSAPAKTHQLRARKAGQRLTPLTHPSAPAKTHQLRARKAGQSVTLSPRGVYYCSTRNIIRQRTVSPSAFIAQTVSFVSFCLLFEYCIVQRTSYELHVVFAMILLRTCCVSAQLQ